MKAGVPLVLPEYLITFIQTLRQLLHDEEFCKRHRTNPKDFTRHRCLTFPIVFIMLLGKTSRSIQRHLHGFLSRLADWRAPAEPTPSAWSQARAKLQPSAFFEINTQCLLPLVYAKERAEELATWHGHRLLGLDSSLVRLPDNPEVARFFRQVEVLTQNGKTGVSYCEGRMSVFYDVLNRIGIDGQLVSGSLSELALATQQLEHAKENDLVLVDCGFTGFVFLVLIAHRKAHFVARCSLGSFAAAQQLFKENVAGVSKLVWLRAPSDQKKLLKEQGLPCEMAVRFVTVRLPDGKLEVLVTSLLDEKMYPTEEFGELYHLRWGHETYHLMLKSRLELENWSGQSALAILQDFAATFLVFNLESLLSGPAEAILAENSSNTEHPQAINRANSYHAIKEQLFELLYSDIPAEEVLLELLKGFLGSPVSVRRNRQVKRRKKPSLYRSYFFQRCRRKSVF